VAPLLKHLRLNVVLQQLDEAPQVSVNTEYVEKPSMRALNVVVGSMGMHLVHIPHRDWKASPEEPVRLEVHYEGPHLGIGADELLYDKSELSVHSLDHVRRGERQGEESVHKPSKAPETPTTTASVQSDKALLPQMLHQSLCVMNNKTS